MTSPTIIIAAPWAGSGKTTVALGLLRTFAARGRTASAFKVGPDPLDAAFLARASGDDAPNLDSWAMRLETLAGLLDETARAGSLIVGEGARGLFDSAPDGTGSTADLASLAGLPVLLVVDAHGLGQSAAALIDGLLRHRDDVEIVGIILNRVRSAGHAEMLTRVCDDHFSTAILGTLGHHPELALPYRRLGATRAMDDAGLAPMLERIGRRVAGEVEIDRVLRLMRGASLGGLGGDAKPWPALGQRIAVARDDVFAAAFASVLEGWRRQGAEILPFSPLADEPPDPAADAVYLSGGPLPPHHLGRLAANERFIRGLHDAAHRGAFVFGEDAGYVVLGRTAVDEAGDHHAMAGLLPLVVSLDATEPVSGYRELVLLEASPLGRPPLRYRGHEAHRGRERERGGTPLAEARDGRRRPLGEVGVIEGSVAGLLPRLIDRHPHLALVR